MLEIEDAGDHNRLPVAARNVYAIMSEIENKAKYILLYFRLILPFYYFISIILSCLLVLAVLLFRDLHSTIFIHMGTLIPEKSKGATLETPI